VRRVQRISNFNGQRKQRLQLQREVADQMFEGLTVENSVATNVPSIWLADVTNRARISIRTAAVTFGW
jgi:hypothetical protein